MNGLPTDRPAAELRQPSARQRVIAQCLARGLKAPLLAVTVTIQLNGSASAEAKALDEHIRLAEDLGAEVIRVQGRDVAGELARVAREHHVTQIVIGQPARTRWRELFAGSVVNRLLSEPTGADIHVVPQHTLHPSD